MNMLKRTGEAEILTAESVRGFSRHKDVRNQLGRVPWFSTARAACYLKISL